MKILTKKENKERKNNDKLFLKSEKKIKIGKIKLNSKDFKLKTTL